MKTGKIFLFTAFLLLAFIYSCEKISSVTTSLPSETPDSLAATPVSNAYTRIMDSICGRAEMPSYDFTYEYAYFIPLDETDSLNCFVVDADVACGAPLGSCGGVQVVMKKGKRWEVVFDDCGWFEGLMGETHGGIRSFRIGQNPAWELEMHWNGSEFVPVKYGFAGIRIGRLRAISAFTSTGEEQIKPDAYEWDLPGIVYPLSQAQMNLGGHDCDVYRMRRGDDPRFLFIFENGKDNPLLMWQGCDSIRATGESRNAWPVLKLTCADLDAGEPDVLFYNQELGFYVPREPDLY